MRERLRALWNEKRRLVIMAATVFWLAFIVVVYRASQPASGDITHVGGRAVRSILVGALPVT